MEINTTTSPTTVDWDISQHKNNNSVQSCIKQANIKSTFTNQRISRLCRIKSRYGTKSNLSRGRPRKYVTEAKITFTRGGSRHNQRLQGYNQLQSEESRSVGIILLRCNNNNNNNNNNNWIVSKLRTIPSHKKVGV